MRPISWFHIFSFGSYKHTFNMGRAYNRLQTVSAALFFNTLCIQSTANIFCRCSTFLNTLYIFHPWYIEIVRA